jgi:pimeloyl-ACP methyl ester carboxylesterase
VRVPDLPGARRLTLDVADVAALREAVRAEAAAGRRVGVAAISFAAAPALVAARAEPAVALVATLGGLHSLEAVAVSAVTGAYRAPGETAWRAGPRHPFAAAAFLLAMAEALPDRADRWLVREAGLRLLERPEAALDDLARSMTGEGRAALALAAERDPEAVPDRLAALPAPVRSVLAALDPARAGLEGLAACVLAVHGEADPIIPATQSMALARATPRSRLILAPGFGHVEPSSVPLEGQLALIRAMRALLAFRDGRDPCEV